MSSCLQPFIALAIKKKKEEFIRRFIGMFGGRNKSKDKKNEDDVGSAQTIHAEGLKFSKFERQRGGGQSKKRQGGKSLGVG